MTNPIKRNDISAQRLLAYFEGMLSDDEEAAIELQMAEDDALAAKARTIFAVHRAAENWTPEAHGEEVRQGEAVAAAARAATAIVAAIERAVQQASLPAIRDRLQKWRDRWAASSPKILPMGSFQLAFEGGLLGGSKGPAGEDPEISVEPVRNNPDSVWVFVRRWQGSGNPLVVLAFDEPERTPLVAEAHPNPQRAGAETEDPYYSARFDSVGGSAFSVLLEPGD